MSKYAVVLNNRVIDAVESDYAPDYPPDQAGIVPVVIPVAAPNVEVQIGMHYDPFACTFYDKVSEAVPPKPAEPSQPTNAEIAQAVSDLEASLVIAGVI